MYRRNRKVVFNDDPLPVEGLGAESGINEYTMILPTDGFIIPFSSGATAALTTNNAGVSTNIACICSGAIYTTTYANSQFTLPDAQGFSFIMPCTATLKQLYFNLSASTVVNLASGGRRDVFLALATAPPGSNVFTVLPYSMTYASFPTGVSTPSGTWLSGETRALELLITAGTKVAIVGGLTATGVSTTQSLTLSMNGGLFFT